MNQVLAIILTGLLTASPPPAREPAPRNILREASRIASRQNERQGYWCDRTLLDIGNIQIRVGDFEAALQSIGHSKYEYDRNSALVDLAIAIARAGQRTQAFAVLRQIGTNHAWSRERLEDDVRMGCLEHEISIGHRERARKTIDEMTTAASRARGLVKLARAYLKASDNATAGRMFAIALAATRTIPDEFQRAEALWDIADAQLIDGRSPAAETVRELVSASDSFKDSWARVSALREAAVRTARMKDRRGADRLFRQAIDAREAIQPPAPCPEDNRIGGARANSQSPSWRRIFRGCARDGSDGPA